MQRSKCMGEEGRLLLLDLIRKNRAVLLSRAIDVRSIPLKARTWEKVAKSLAASGLGPQRTVKQVKKIWENMRSRAKKFASDEKKNLLKTGGGPPSPMAKPDPVLEKIFALTTEELAPAPNHNDSDRWLTDVVVYLDEMGEQAHERKAMNEQPSETRMVPISLMPTGGSVSAPLASTSSGTTTLQYSPVIDITPCPVTSVEVRGNVVSTHSSSNNCTPLLTTALASPATVVSCNTPLPSTSGLASLPATFPSEIPPIKSSTAKGKVSAKQFQLKKRQVEDSAGSREAYAMVSKFQKEEHDIVMQIHKQNLENKKLEGEYLRQKMQMMTSLYAQARDTLEDVPAVAASLVDLMDNFRKDQS